MKQEKVIHNYISRNRIECHRIEQNSVAQTALKENRTQHVQFYAEAHIRDSDQQYVTLLGEAKTKLQSIIQFMILYHIQSYHDILCLISLNHTISYRHQ